MLKDAGVVDAGGAGLARARARRRRGRERRADSRAAAGRGASRRRGDPPGALALHATARSFLIEGKELDREALETELEQLGDSLLVVGDENAIKVHVHTDDPGAALSIGTRVGTIDRIEIANMHEQTQEREERLLAAVPDAPRAQSGVVAVVAGDGNRRSSRASRRTSARSRSSRAARR